MKNIIYVVCFLALITGFTASAQVYQSAEDTAKLNKEFTEVSNDIANLTARLTVAQNNLPTTYTITDKGITEGNRLKEEV